MGPSWYIWYWILDWNIMLSYLKSNGDAFEPQTAPPRFAQDFDWSIEKNHKGIPYLFCKVG